MEHEPLRQTAVNYYDRDGVTYINGRKQSIGNESVPIQLAQCWFPGLAISNAIIQIYFSSKIYGSDFIKQHSETVMV